MTSTTVPYAVPREPGAARAIVLAVLVHAMLFGLLWFGISWVSQPPQSMDPDFVVDQSQVDTPPPEPEPVPQPQPTPPVADPTPPEENPEIQLEKQRKHDEELKKVEEQKKADQKRKQEEQEAADKKREEDQKKLADKKQKQADDAKLAKLLAADKARMAAGGSPNAGPSTPGKVDGKGDAAWISRVSAKVRSLITRNAIPLNTDPNVAAEFEVSLLPDGSVAGIRQTKSSGSPVFDDAARRAIELAAPYPADSSGGVPKHFTSTNKPKDQQ